jgi:Flp pilus assembly protein TadG
MQKHSTARAMAGRLGRALVQGVRRFGGERKGGVAVPFALTAVPLAFLSLAAMDFHRANMIKTGLQDALDAAALTVGRSTATSPTTIQQLGADALAANLKQYPNTHLDTSSFVLNGQTIQAAAQVSVTPLVADVFGGGNLQVGASSEVVRAVNKLEVAMVLDNTGSMAGTKITMLKTAASNFVDTLSAAAARSADPNAVRIGLVPFSMTVNVGSQYQNASWMDTTAISPINDQIFASHANRFTLFQQMGVTWGGCVESRQAPYDIQETAPSSSTPATLFTPYFAPDEPGSTGTSTTWNSMTWYNNYIPDVTTASTWNARQGYVAKYNTHTLRTGTNGSTGYIYGPNAGCQLQPLMRLTTNWSGLKTAINGMTPVGDTNIPMGMVWGWHLLSPNAPFADGVAYSTPQTTKIVVMMTDGQNQNTANSNSNASFYSGDGYIWQNRLGISSGTNAQRQAALDGRLAALCTNMKAQGIIIYTVRVEVNDNQFQVLQNCASSPSKFYDVQNASDLNAVFDAIAGSIENLRISR